MNLFLDIETIPTGDKLTLNDISAPGQWKKSDSIEKWKKEHGQESIEKEYRSRSTSIYKSRMVCLAYALGEDQVQVLSGSEKEIIAGFWEFLQK